MALKVYYLVARQLGGFPVALTDEPRRVLIGFEPVASANTSAMPYQLSCKATHWQRGQFIDFISPVKSEMM